MGWDLVTSTLYALLASPFRDGERTPKSLYRHVALTGVRALISRTTPRQQQYVMLSTVRIVIRHNDVPEICDDRSVPTLSKNQIFETEKILVLARFDVLLPISF